MLDKNSAEYKTIMALYEDGRITAEERNKLLVAHGANTVKADTKKSSGETKRYSLLDSDADFNGTGGTEQNEDKNKEPKQSSPGLVDIISAAVSKGISAAKKAGKAIIGSLSVPSGGEEFDLAGGTLITNPVKCDCDYNELQAAVKYTNGGDVHKFKCDADDPDDVIDECKRIMSAPVLAALKKAFGDRFVGTFRYILGKESLRVYVYKD